MIDVISALERKREAYLIDVDELVRQREENNTLQALKEQMHCELMRTGFEQALDCWDAEVVRNDHITLSLPTEKPIAINHETEAPKDVQDNDFDIVAENRDTSRYRVHIFYLEVCASNTALKDAGTDYDKFMVDRQPSRVHREIQVPDQKLVCMKAKNLTVKKSYLSYKGCQRSVRPRSPPVSSSSCEYFPSTPSISPRTKSVQWAQHRRSERDGNVCGHTM